STVSVHPLFSRATRVEVVCPFQFPKPQPDGLGIATQDTCDVLDPTVSQLRGLDRCIPPSIVLSQRVKQPSHHPFDFRYIGVHVALLDAPFQTEGLRSYAKEDREVITGLLLRLPAPSKNRIDLSAGDA